MSGEREIFRRRPGSNDPNDELNGPDAERLQNARNQAGDFDSVIGRALASLRNQKNSAENILKSIRNPGGE